MKRTTSTTKKKMDLTPTWSATLQMMLRAMRNGPDPELKNPEADFWEPMYSELARMAALADKSNEAQKLSLWNRITAEELAAEDLCLLPRSLLREGQMAELIAWLRKSSDNAGREADELEEFGERREGKNVLPLKP